MAENTIIGMATDALHSVNRLRMSLSTTNDHLRGPRPEAVSKDDVPPTSMVGMMEYVGLRLSDCEKIASDLADIVHNNAGQSAGATARIR